MKKTYIILLTFILFFTASCSEWLNVEPQSKIIEKKFFSDKSGYVQALAGIYTIMNTDKLYGDYLTFSILDILAQNYKLKKSLANAKKIKFAEFDYTTDYANNIFTEIWSTQFNAIANCNNLIDNITKESSKKIIGRKALYKQLYGETLALRAFLHFDLLRMFHPSYKSNKEYKAMPYIKVFSKDIKKSKAQSTQEIIKEILKDLKKSYQLLNECKDSDLSKEEGATEETYGNHKMHPDDVSVNLLARIYIYKGDMKNALKYAEMIIKKYSEEFEFGTYAINSNFSSEILFKIYITSGSINEIKRKYFPKNIFNKSHKSSHLLCDDHKIKELYPDKNDHRYRFFYLKDIKLKNEQNRFAVLRKCELFSGSNSDGNETFSIPIIRLAEIYLIASECLAKTDFTKAVSYLHKLQEVRGMKLKKITDEKSLMEEISREYQREFIGEGQLFYFYKRINKPSIKSYKGTIIEMNDKKYTFPLPKAESKFGL